jgi:hypothetical protein
MSIRSNVQLRFGMAQGRELGAESVFPAQELFLAEAKHGVRPLLVRY